MHQKRNKLGFGIAIGAAGVLALLGVALLAVVYTGAYNVAATEAHMPLTRWAFDTTLHRSVSQRAGGLALSAEAVTPAMLAAGAGEYKAMCQQCHGGPGAERDSWAEGMRPQPPDLQEAASEWTPGELFWIVKHGIRMTGMPAFGPSHDDETLRAIVAFVQQLPGMTPQRYAALGGSRKESHGRPGHGHGHGQ